MTAETVASHRPAPDWMHQPITAAEYDSLPEELCADIEIVDGMVVMSPSATPRHNRIARLLANALDTASPAEWFADSDFDVRLQDIPLTNRCPDIVVYQADKIDARPMRPQYILLVVEVVSPARRPPIASSSRCSTPRRASGTTGESSRSLAPSPRSSPTNSTRRP